MMAASCPRGFDIARLRKQVSQTYDRLAREPTAIFISIEDWNTLLACSGTTQMNWQQSQRNVPHLLPASAIRIGIGPVAAGETILDIG
jgi:hypothetical protein